MSKLICGLLLLVVVVSFWCDNRVSASKWVPRNMRRCWCKENCHKSSSPKTDVEKLRFRKCLCFQNHLLKYKDMSVLDIQKKCNNTPKYPIPSNPIGFL